MAKTGIYETIIQESAEIKETAAKQRTRSFDIVKNQDITRSKIALLFVRWYFILISLVFAISLIYNFLVLKFLNSRMDQLLNPKDLILLISSTVGTSLGFIVGYYFKGLEEKDKVTSS